MVSPPRTVPTREEIADLGLRDPFVAARLELFRRGRVSYETALAMALCDVVAVKDRAVEAVMTAWREAGDDGVYLRPDRRPSPPPKARRGLVVRVWLAGFVAGAAAGCGLTILFWAP